MNSIKRLGAAVALTFVLSLSAFAGEVNTPPCAAPDPGEVNTPPCAGQTSDNSTDPGEISTPPASNAVDIVSVAEGAMNVLQSMLTVF